LKLFIRIYLRCLINRQLAAKIASWNDDLVRVLCKVYLFSSSISLHFSFLFGTLSRLSSSATLYQPIVLPFAAVDEKRFAYIHIHANTLLLANTKVCISLIHSQFCNSLRLGFEARGGFVISYPQWHKQGKQDSYLNWLLFVGYSV
jgi:hypothetical protein